MPLKKLKEGFGKLFGKEEIPEYVEIDLEQDSKKNKVVVKHYLLENFEEINDILNGLREGYTIAVIDIKPLKKKDIIELKRAIAKLKKTVEALEGEIKGFVNDIIIATPSFAEIKQSKRPEKPQQDKDFY